MSHTRRLSPQAKDKMREFYHTQPEWKEYLSLPEFYYTFVEESKSPSPTVFKPKRLKHYSPVTDLERPRAKTI